ncbi:MAG: GGDEF domain-containing protein [Ilumatobacter sp.]
MLDATVESPEDLIALIRQNGLGSDMEIVERIDRALDQTTDDADLGSLYVARALALQCQGNASAPAAAARNAVPHLVAAGDMETAAFASAMSAVFLDQSGASIAAVDHAVDALVMLGDLGPTSEDGPMKIEGVRAALALSGFFMRLSAFDLAVATAQRAFEGGLLIEGFSMDSVALSVGYLTVESAHVTEDDDLRETSLELAYRSIDWLEANGFDDSSRTLLGKGLRAETRHILGRSSCDLELDGDAHLYDDTRADLVAWHQMVRGTSAQFRGDPEAAIALFDLSIPGLEASSDDHCLVRALRGRSQARALAGDFAGAFADASDLAERVRGWQIAQVGRLAFQLARRADLERSTTELRNTAQRLADDIARDATTGVNSRRWLEGRLDELAATDLSGSTIMCDIDHFKSVNDTYGHHIGDDVLRQFGMLLHDVAGNADIARFGGEEFVVVLHDPEPSTGVDVAERIRAATENHDWSTLAEGLGLTVSCGVVHGPLRNVRPMLIAADVALLDAKRGGRNRVMAPLQTPTC